MAEGIPAAIVKFVQAAVHVDTTPTSSSSTALAASVLGQGLGPPNDDAASQGAAGAAVGAGGGGSLSPRPRPRPLHLLPRAAGVYLSQALYQLSSRVQNRGHLLAVGAPGRPLTKKHSLVHSITPSHTRLTHSPTHT